MKLFTAHRNWWSTLSSTFIGSLLGIGITFAISDYIQTQHQTRMAKRMIIMTIDELDGENHAMSNKINDLMHADSIYSALETYYRRDVPMPKDSINLFYGTLYKINIDDNNNIAQNIFKSNLEVMDIFEDLTIVKDINEVFGLINSQKDCYGKTNKIIQEFLEYNLQNHIESKDDFWENFANYQYDYYKAEYNFLLFHVYTLSLSIINKLIEDNIQQLQQKLGVSNTDINQLNYSRLNNRGISVSEKKSYDSEGNLTQDEQTIEKE